MMTIFHFLGMVWVVLGVCVFTALTAYLVVQGLHRVIERMEIGREFEESVLTDPGVQVMVRKGER